MTNNHSNIKRKQAKHLSDIQRGRLEEMAKEGKLSQAKMALELGVDQSTVSRELRRGKVHQMAYDRSYYECYSAEAGSRVYKENRMRSHAKDFQHKYSEAFFKKIPKAIQSAKNDPRKQSVDTFVHTYRKKHPDEKVPCTKTVYALIDQGVLSVRNIDLPMKTSMRPRKKKRSEPKGKNVKRLGRSIEERDPSVLSREAFGHWEVDLVLGKKTKGEPVILTMIERKTRFLLTKKVWGKSAELIQKAALQLMEKHGIEQFKSLTTDNGSEFALLSQIEEQTSSVEVFFAHAFASWEKGTNERHNGLLREFVPKGHSLRNLRYQELQLYTDAINERPRRILDYATPKECLESEIDRIVAA